MTTKDQIRTTILDLAFRFVTSRDLGRNGDEFHRGYAWGIHQATIDLLKCMDGGVLSREEVEKYTEMID